MAFSKRGNDGPRRWLHSPCWIRTIILIDVTLRGILSQRSKHARLVYVMSVAGTYPCNNIETIFFFFPGVLVNSLLVEKTVFPTKFPVPALPINVISLTIFPRRESCTRRAHRSEIRPIIAVTSTIRPRTFFFFFCKSPILFSPPSSL